MYSVSNISVYYPGKELLKSVSFIINPRDRIGLVGKNGSGKTTLLNIIAGIKQADQGTVVIPEGKTIGYLRQELGRYEQKSVIEEALEAFQEVNQIEKELNELTIRLEKMTDHHDQQYLKLLNILAEKHDRLNFLDKARQESHVEKILKGLGFSPADFNRKITEFSGGWQMRVEMAKILLLRPDLLLLDEPTNHLDIDSILWLEDFLKNYQGAMIIISHDKTFLNNVCERTIEVVNGSIYDYKLRYDDFLAFREQRLETQRNAQKNQQRYIEQQERFIERFRAKNTKAKQVRSKLKRLEKIERIELDETDNAQIKFRFPKAPHSGQLIFDCRQLVKKYGEKTVLNGIDFRIDRGDRIAFVGKNGEGKTTLVKILMKLEKYEGEIKFGHQIKTGYYAQIQEHTLDESLTVYETIEREASGEFSGIQKIRTLLGVFLFGDEDMDKKVKVLSGGEKSRLALARLLLKTSNVLILDEPTNHLDISSKEVLKSALKEFDGTLILVSHDRDFMEGLTNKTFEFSGGRIIEHPGPINKFLEHHHVETFRAFEINLKASLKKSPAPSDDNRNKNSPTSFQKRKESEKELKKLKNKISSTERQIEQLENQLKEIEDKMHHPDYFSKPDHALKLSEDYSNIKASIDQKMEEWEEIVTRFNELNDNLL